MRLVPEHEFLKQRGKSSPNIAALGFFGERFARYLGRSVYRLHRLARQQIAPAQTNTVLLTVKAPRK